MMRSLVRLYQPRVRTYAILILQCSTARLFNATLLRLAILQLTEWQMCEGFCVRCALP